MVINQNGMLINMVKQKVKKNMKKNRKRKNIPNQLMGILINMAKNWETKNGMNI